MAALAARPAPGIQVTAPPCPEPAVDHVHLARYTLGNRALEIEVLRLFAAQAPDYLEAMRTAATEKAWRDAAHTLKGSARAVGAFRVAQRAERAEALNAMADKGLQSAAVEAIAAALEEAGRHIETLQSAMQP